MVERNHEDAALVEAASAVRPGAAGHERADTAAPGAPALPADRIVSMQTFMRIVEAGSLSAAAALLGSTQPTVSRRLQALERSLGVQLLRRSTHAMKLTEDGDRCVEHARHLRASWESIESDLRGESEPVGLLRTASCRIR